MVGQIGLLLDLLDPHLVDFLSDVWLFFYQSVFELGGGTRGISADGKSRVVFAYFGGESWLNSVFFLFSWLGFILLVSGWVKFALAIFVKTDKFFGDGSDFIRSEVKIAVFTISAEFMMVFVSLHINNPVNMKILYSAHKNFGVLEGHLVFTLLVSADLFPDGRYQILVKFISILEHKTHVQK